MTARPAAASAFLVRHFAFTELATHGRDAGGFASVTFYCDAPGGLLTEASCAVASGEDAR